MEKYAVEHRRMLGAARASGLPYVPLNKRCLMYDISSERRAAGAARLFMYFKL